jgi:DNA polymerase-3 subunit delta
MKKSLREVLRTIESGNIDPAYLFHGEDQFLQQFIIDKIKIGLFGSSNGEKTLLLPDEMGGKEIMERLTNIDLFSSKRLFVMRNPQQLKSPYRNEFLDYCKNPINSNCLVIILEEYRESVAMVRDLKKILDGISVRTPYQKELKEWVRYFLKENGVEYSSDALDSLIDIAGDSLHHLANEVKKISLMLDDNQSLTVELVKQFSGWKKEHQRWEFLIAVGQKDLNNSVKIGLSIINFTESMLSLLYPLTSLFQEIMFNNMNAGTFSRNIGYIALSASVKRRLPEFTKNYTYQESAYALELLFQIDQRIKTTNSIDESELIQFLFKLLQNHA